jgi:hypothetical protein
MFADVDALGIEWSVLEQDGVYEPIIKHDFGVLQLF